MPLMTSNRKNIGHLAHLRRHLIQLLFACDIDAQIDHCRLIREGAYVPLVPCALRDRVGCQLIRITNLLRH
jgi:hypothetical protein